MVLCSFSFFFNDAATTEIYTLSYTTLFRSGEDGDEGALAWAEGPARKRCNREDRKSTRLNSSHVAISYAVFCLKKKNGVRCEPSVNLHEKVDHFSIARSCCSCYLIVTVLRW